MVQTLPRVRSVLGDEGTDELLHYFDERLQTRAVPRDEYRQVLSRLDVLEHGVTDVKTSLLEMRREMTERFDRIHERFDQMYQHFETRFDRQNRHIETRFDVMNERLDRMNERFDDRLDRLNERFDEMSHRMLVQTRWMVGTIALFGTLITVLLTVSQFTP